MTKMKGIIKTVAIGSLALASLAFIAPAEASVWNKKTNLTVNESIEVPGAILPPGQYVVKLVDSQSNRNIVQFLNDREDKVYSTVIAIPNQRLEPTGDSVFSFYEVPQGQPPALHAWFYPGDTFGQEFVYSKRRGEEIAQMTHQTVATVPEATEPMTQPEAEEVVPPPVVTEPEASVADSDQSNEAAAQSSPTPAENTQEEYPLMAQNQPPPTPAPEPAANQLPQTASQVPLAGLLGVTLMIAAGGLFVLARRA